MSEHNPPEPLDAGNTEYVAAPTAPRPGRFTANQAYDALKFVAQILLPAVGVAYYGFAGIWGLPQADEVVGSILVIDTFLGVFLAFWKAKYDNSDAAYDGEVILTPDHENGMTNVNFLVPPHAVQTQKSIVLKVDDRQ